MKISVFGSGYVGLVTAACFAEMDHQILCCDIDAKKIQDLNNHKISIYEPRLSRLVQKNLDSKHLSFSSNQKDAAQFSSMIFVCVGTPENILECIGLGIDMFDCVMPTRNARNGMLFTSEGFINIKNKKWQTDFTSIDPNGTAEVDSAYSKAYLRHLIISKEILGAQIASIHNLSFYLWLVKQARTKIVEGTFSSWKTEMIRKVTTRL